MTEPDPDLDDSSQSIALGTLSKIIPIAWLALFANAYLVVERIRDREWAGAVACTLTTLVVGFSLRAFHTFRRVWLRRRR